MGTYGYDEFVELFGGPPEPGEYAHDWREAVDIARKEAKEAGSHVPPLILARDPLESAYQRGIVALAEAMHDDAAVMAASRAYHAAKERNAGAEWQYAILAAVTAACESLGVTA